MISDHLQSLLADARLLVDYAIRAGRLQSADLLDAMNVLDGEESASGESMFKFQTAFNAAVAAIAPMTLVDLRAGRSPFDERNIRGRKRWQVGLSIATVGLIASIAYYQLQVQRQGDALRAYRGAVEAKGPEKLTAVRQVAQYRKALDENSCYFNEYQKARHELRQLAARAADATYRLNELRDASPWPFGNWVRSITLRFSQDSGGVGAVGTAVAASAVLDVAQASQAAELSHALVDICDERTRPQLLGNSYPKWLSQVVSDSIDEFCFANKLNVDYLTGNDITGGARNYLGRGTSDPVPEVEQRIRLQTAWLLPFLYGLLGACVYVMRRLLFDTRTAVVENFVILLRLALGALAGVVIGWFATSSVASGLSATGPESWQYVLAFLAGFSIDNLFNLLDRMNRVVSGKDKPPAAGTT